MSTVVPEELKSKLISEGKFLVSEIDPETIRSIERWILQNRTGKDPETVFTLLINSSGGNPGLALYFASFMRTLHESVRVKGVAFGECGSAALALLQCCHERVAVKHCGFFIHNINTNITTGCQTASQKSFRLSINNSRKLEDELVILQAKRCGIKKQKWRKLAQDGQENGSAILTREALELGLIDSVVDHYPIF